MSLFTDRVFRLPRIWSNHELKKHAHLFSGDVVNVSAWKDYDKVSQHYRDYFINATSYTITNYTTDTHGYQGTDEEILLDLQAPLPQTLHQKFDVVFNHTTLEHIYDVKTAFHNLCAMSKDIVIVIVPFLQQYHSDFGDYWRFTPLVLKKMFEEEGFSLLYQSFNSHKNASVYLYTIASRTPQKWEDEFQFEYSVVDPLAVGNNPYVGARAISNLSYRLRTLIKRVVKI